MKSINRFIYGPTPEEKVKGWQQKLRQQERQLEREVLNVSREGITRSISMPLLGERGGWERVRLDTEELLLPAKSS